VTTYQLTAFIVIAFAAFRLWKLAAEDVILDKPRDWLLGTTELAGGLVHYKRAKLATFIGCPWCLGFWISLAGFAAWHWWSHYGTVLIALPFAVSALVGLIAKLDE
jgi:hypothetical protein